MYLIIIIIILTIFIYNVSGIYLIIHFLLAVINYIVATIKLIGSPINNFLRLVQVFCLLTIIFIVAYNIWILIIKLLAQWV